MYVSVSDCLQECVCMCACVCASVCVRVKESERDGIESIAFKKKNLLFFARKGIFDFLDLSLSLLFGVPRAEVRRLGDLGTQSS